MSNNQNWYVTAASVAGKGHVERDLPCQDAHHYTPAGRNWMVAAVADGAGSQTHSEYGSQLACQQVVKLLSESVVHHKWVQTSTIPDTRTLNLVVSNIIVTVLAELNVKAAELGVDIKSLACTLMAVVGTEHGLFGFQVGDGRGCYLDNDGIWKPLFVPFRGEFANETIFLTSSPLIGGDINEYVTVFRFEGDKLPFALLSDGCEMASFECHIVDDETGHFSDPNRPFPGFFNPILQTLRSMADKNTPEVVNHNWAQFLDSGTERLSTESDDKTMLVAFWR